MAKAYTCYTADVLFLNLVLSKLGNHNYCIVRWLGFSCALLRNALTLLLAHYPQLLKYSTTVSISQPSQDKETSHPFFTHTHPTSQMHKSSNNNNVSHRNQRLPPRMQHVIPSFFQTPTEPSPDDKYPPLIHTQPLVPGQVYVPHVDDDSSASSSPPSTRCSSSTLALSDDDTRKIFTRPGPERMMTPSPVCEKREQLKTRELLMMSAHTYPYAAPFYAVNQSRNRDDENQKHQDFLGQSSRPPPPPLEVAPYRSLERVWKKDFISGLEAADLPIMGFHARSLVNSNCIWDEEELLHLSRAFIWRASERGERSTDSLAAFASQIYQIFRIAPWTGTDEHFRRCLWYIVSETFVSSWHFEEQRTTRQAVMYVKDPSPKYKEFVVSALSICSFIGDLFRYGLLNRPDTVGCIRVLNHNLTTVEHVTATQNIIKHAGLPLWRQALNLETEVADFQKFLVEKAKPLKDYRTVLLRPMDGNAGVRSKVEDILAYVAECRLLVLNEQRRAANPN